MSQGLKELLTAEKGMIFRIAHLSNVKWILEHGLHCSESEIRDPAFVSIGNAEVIARRQSRQVPVAPGGTLGDYVPFYFTPCSPMLLNLKTGWRGAPIRPMEEIVVLVSSIERLENQGIPYLFTDRHALLKHALFFDSREHLDQVDFARLQNRDFAADPEDPGKMDRYQAEALVHRMLPVTALLGIACYTEEVRGALERDVTSSALGLFVATRREWYFE
jgi:hypothetical protein